MFYQICHLPNQLIQLPYIRDVIERAIAHTLTGKAVAVSVYVPMICDVTSRFQTFVIHRISSHYENEKIILFSSYFIDGTS